MNYTDFLVSMGLSTLFTFLKSLKGPANKAKWKAAILKLYRNIQGAYADDPDFQ
jgi:hypothetical protein